MATYVNPLRVHVIRVGDTLTPLAVELKRPSGAPVDLTGLTIKFKLLNSAGTAVVAETTSNVTVTAATLGRVQYDFQSADVATAGTYYAYFTVYSGSERDTFPVDSRRLVVEITSD